MAKSISSTPNSDEIAIMEKARALVAYCLDDAIRTIDKALGDGFAQAHPDVLINHQKLVATHIAAGTTRHAVDELIDALKEVGAQVATIVEEEYGKRHQ